MTGDVPGDPISGPEVATAAPPERGTIQVQHTMALVIVTRLDTSYEEISPALRNHVLGLVASYADVRGLALMSRWRLCFEYPAGAYFDQYWLPDPPLPVSLKPGAADPGT